jgi:hypothetical protein
MTAAAEAHADSAIGALVRGMRPGQWIKNLLVVAAPFMVGRLDERSVQLATVGALVCFLSRRRAISSVTCTTSRRNACTRSAGTAAPSRPVNCPARRRSRRVCSSRSSRSD